jgi:hypothetical protein
MVQNYYRDAAHTPRTIMKLDFCNYQQNKHNSRINISVKYKIVINSPEVCCGIKRQYVKLCCKNLIIFSYKNHLCIFYRNGKQFL